MKLPKNIHPRDDAPLAQNSAPGAEKRRRTDVDGASKLDRILCQDHLRDAILRDVLQSDQSIDRFALSHPAAAGHALDFVRCVQSTKMADLLQAAEQSYHRAPPRNPQKPLALPFSEQEVTATEAFLHRRVATQRPLHEARRLCLEGRPEESLQLYAQIVADHPQWAQAHLEYLLTYLHVLASPRPRVSPGPNKHEMSHAVSEAGRLHPTDRNILLVALEVALRLYNRQLLQLTMSRIVASKDQFNQQHFGPSDRNNYGLTEACWGRQNWQLYRDAARIFEDRLRGTVSAYFVARLVGEAYVVLGQSDKLLHCFHQAYVLSAVGSKDTYLFRKYGELCWLARRGGQIDAGAQRDASEIAFKRALESNPADEATRLTFASFLFDAGHFSRARALIEDFSMVPNQTFSSHASRTCGISLCLMSEKKFQEAIDRLGPLTLSLPDKVSELRAIHVLCALASGQKVDEPKLLKWVETGSPAIQMVYVSGLLYARLGNLEAAIAAFTTALAETDAGRRQFDLHRITVLAFSSHLPLIEVLELAGKKEEAIAVLTRASALWPLRHAYKEKLVQLRQV